MTRTRAKQVPAKAGARANTAYKGQIIVDLEGRLVVASAETKGTPQQRAYLWALAANPNSYASPADLRRRLQAANLPDKRSGHRPTPPTAARIAEAVRKLLCHAGLTSAQALELVDVDRGSDRLRLVALPERLILVPLPAPPAPLSAVSALPEDVQHEIVDASLGADPLMDVRSFTHPDGRISVTVTTPGSCPVPRETSMIVQGNRITVTLTPVGPTLDLKGGVSFLATTPTRADLFLRAVLKWVEERFGTREAQEPASPNGLRS